MFVDRVSPNMPVKSCRILLTPLQGKVERILPLINSRTQTQQQEKTNMTLADLIPSFIDRSLPVVLPASLAMC